MLMAPQLARVTQAAVVLMQTHLQKLQSPELVVQVLSVVTDLVPEAAAVVVQADLALLVALQAMHLRVALE
jgi:hypothetical protein